MAINREGRLHALEKGNGKKRGDWLPHEQALLAMLSTLSGLTASAYPPYPLISGDLKLGDVERRTPAYQLWGRLEYLRRYYEHGIRFVSQLLVAWCADNCPDGSAIPQHRIYDWRQQYAETVVAKDMLRMALEPITREYVGEIPHRKGAYAWYELPRVLSNLPCGFARKWASVSLAQRLYSPWRSPVPTSAEPLKAPTWPDKQYYILDI